MYVHTGIKFVKGKISHLVQFLTNHFGKRNFLRRFSWLEGYVCESVVGPTAVTEATNIPPVKSLPVILCSN